MLVTCIKTLYDCSCFILSLKSNCEELIRVRNGFRQSDSVTITVITVATRIMAVIHRTVGEFDPTLEDWSSYTEQLQLYFTANDVEEAKQKAILLSGCGVATYRLIKNLTAPEKPTDKTFAQLVQLVGEHHNPKPSKIVERFRFNTRNRQQGESMATFIAELWHLTRYCNFGDSLKEMLRDRLVCDIENGPIQRRLLAEPSLTLDKAIEIAIAMESADRNARDLQKTQHPQTVNVLKYQSPSKAPDRNAQTVECYRCGGAHLATDCRFKDSECRWCKKKGHIARVCRSKKGTEHSKSASTSSHKTGVKSQSTSKINKNSSEPTHSVESTITEADTDASTYTLFNVTSSPTKPFVVTIQINGAYLPMEVDTGASRTLISKATFDKLWSLHNAPSLQPTVSKL